MLLLTAHKAPRIKSGDLIRRQDAEPSADNRNALISPTRGEICAYNRLAEKNPAFTLLVNTLNLEEVSSTVIQQAPVGGGPISNPSPAVKLTGLSLKEIAERVFDPGNSYTETEAIERLANLTVVTTDRAKNGMALMYAQRILSQTATNTYYLSESTPF